MSFEDGPHGELVREWHGEVGGQDVVLYLYDLNVCDPQTGHHRMGLPLPAR